MGIDIKETNLNFNSLSERSYTDQIVLHHTGGNDIDASAEQIHGWHLKTAGQVSAITMLSAKMAQSSVADQSGQSVLMPTARTVTRLVFILAVTLNRLNRLHSRLRSALC